MCKNCSVSKSKLPVPCIINLHTAEGLEVEIHYSPLSFLYPRRIRSERRFVLGIRQTSPSIYLSLPPSLPLSLPPSSHIYTGKNTQHFAQNSHNLAKRVHDDKAKVSIFIYVIYIFGATIPLSSSLVSHSSVYLFPFIFIYYLHTFVGF